MGILDQLQSLLPKGKLDVNKRFEKLREAISGTMSNFFMARDRQTDEIVGLKVGDREKVTLFEGRFKGLKKPAEGEIAMGMKHPLNRRDFGAWPNNGRLAVSGNGVSRRTRVAHDAGCPRLAA